MKLLFLRMPLIRATFGASVALTCGGCIYSTNTVKTTSGTFIADSDVGRINGDGNKPTKDDIVKRFGQPDQTLGEADGSASLLYKSCERTDQQTTVFLFYDDHAEEVGYRRVFFDFDNKGTFKGAKVCQ
jgi:hypothetical protein